MYRMMRPWFWIPWVWNLTDRGRIFNETINQMHKFTRDIIREREGNNGSISNNGVQNSNNGVQSSKRLAFLDLLLQMKKEGKLNEEDVREEVDTFMFEVCIRDGSSLQWWEKIRTGLGLLQGWLFPTVVEID